MALCTHRLDWHALQLEGQMALVLIMIAILSLSYVGLSVCTYPERHARGKADLLLLLLLY